MANIRSRALEHFLPLLLLLLSRSPGLAQGVVNFNNRLAGTSTSHIYGPLTNFPSFSQTGNGPNDTPHGDQDWTGFTPLEGSGFMASLMSAPATNAPESALVFVGPVTTFRTGLAAGNVVPVSGITVATTPEYMATFEVFAWDNQSGLFNDPTNAWTAWRTGLIAGGTSPSFMSWATPIDTATPANLVGLQSFNIFALSSPTLPLIVRQPQSQTAPLGASVAMSVRVYGSNGNAPFHYQWYFNDTNAIPDATNSVFRISETHLAQTGSYKVVVTNIAGSATSDRAFLNVTTVLGVSVVPAISLVGDVGDTLRLDYINAIGPTNAWIPLATITMTNTNQIYIDLSALGQPRRYYRSVFLP
jgi:hypothetical protein